MITEKQKGAIRAAGCKAYDRRQEACGIITTRGKVVECENVAATLELDPGRYFAISAEDLARRDIKVIWHTHINSSDVFSPADVRTCRAMKEPKPFLLHDVMLDRWRYADPSIDAPILGGEFTYGIEDCYTVVRRYYWQNFQVELTDYDRADLYDERGNYIFNSPGWDEFRRFFQAEGFEELETRACLEKGDLLLFQLNGAANPNHIGVVDDPIEAVFCHQLIGLPARREFWYGDAGYWKDNTVAILRRPKDNGQQ